MTAIFSVCSYRQMDFDHGTFMLSHGFSYPSRAKSCITLERNALIQGCCPQPRYEYLFHGCIEFIKLSFTLETMEKKEMYPSFLLRKLFISIRLQSVRILLCRIGSDHICTGFFVKF